MGPKIVVVFVVFLFLASPTFALKETKIFLPAVQETEYGYRGVLATLIVDIKKGSGHVYVDTEPLTKIDTQASARIAKKVSCDILYLDCSNYDFFYTIRSDSQIVGGPSGGAAMTVATLASLLDLNLSKEVFMTGTINLDGSIGPVSAILEKARVVSKKGSVFLIPYKESIVVDKTNNNKIDVKEYAKQHYNLTIIEVKTIKEAFKYFTNYEIEEPKVKFQKSEEFTKVMKNLAEDLINKSKELKKECEMNLKTTKMDYNYQKQVSDICKPSLDEAIKNYKIRNYYSSASLAFSNMISYLYGNNLMKFLNEEDKKTFVYNYLKSVENEFFDVNTSNIELYTIIKERQAEAQNKLEEAWKNYYNRDYIQSVYYGSFAEARLYTAKIWDRYADSFPKYIEKKPEGLEEIARGVISNSYSILTYSSMTSSNYFLDEAKELLDSAKENYKWGEYYSAIILGLKSEANSELAAEILNNDIEGLTELHRKRAIIFLNKTKSVIGQCYFEYADTLRKDNKQMALIYYTYAEKLSKLKDILNKPVIEERVEPEISIKPVVCKEEKYIQNFFILLLLSFLGGIIIGKI